MSHDWTLASGRGSTGAIWTSSCEIVLTVQNQKKNERKYTYKCGLPISSMHGDGFCLCHYCVHSGFGANPAS
jgi:hypothetical protein